jgi:hypothetical protein
LIESPHNADRIRIEKALSVDIRHPENLWFISGDDKGLVDLVYLGFLLFDPTISSIFKMAGSLFLISISLFAAEFYARGARMALLISLLASLYAVLFTFGITDQSVSIIEPRFLGFIGVVALLHLSLLIIDGKSLSKRSIVLAAGQALVLVFVFHLRSSEMWQYLCIASISAIAIVTRWRRLTSAHVVIPALILITAASLSIYRNLTYHSYYFTNDVSARILWHTALTGLGVNPALRERYGLNALDDTAVIKAVEKYLESIGETEARAQLFVNPNGAERSFYHFKWSIYEPAARHLYYRIWREMPGEVVKTYIFLMPKTFIANVYYMATGRHVFDEFLFLVGTVEKSSTRIAKDLYLSPFRFAPIAVLLISAAVLGFSRSLIIDPACIVASAAAALASALPPFIATPVMHYCQLAVMMMLTLTYFAATTVLALAIRRAIDFCGGVQKKAN